MYLPNSVTLEVRTTYPHVWASQVLRLEEAENDDEETKRLRKLKEDQRKYENSRSKRSQTPIDVGTEDPAPQSGDGAA